MKYLLIILIALTACRTTKKVSKADVKTDSTRVVKTDTSTVSTEKATMIKGTKVTIKREKKNNRTVTTVIEDYKVPDTVKETVIVRRTKIIEKDRGNTRIEQTTTDTITSETVRTDSSGGKRSDSTKVVKSEVTKDKEIKKTSGGGWINAGLVVLALIVIIAVGYYLYRKFRI